MKLAFMGGGVMAEAFIKGILAKGLASPSDISVSDVDAGRRGFLTKEYGVKAVAENSKAIPDAEVVVMAIKPQNLAEVMADLKGKLQPHQLVVSIVAGATMSTLTTGLGHRTVIRTMPNTPGQIGQGMTVWMATEAVSTAQKEQARQVLTVLGREIYADKEDYLNIATALSGSGPAYVFLILEALTEAAVYLGMPWAAAKEMAIQTVAGSALLAQSSGKPLAELRNQVTSPGGTTAAGLLKLEEGKLRAVLAEAVIAACEKARALGGDGKK